MAIQMQMMCRGALEPYAQPHFERLIPVDTNEPTSYVQMWSVGRTENDNVRAYLTGTANNYELHFYGYGATANYGIVGSGSTQHTQAPYYNYLLQIRKYVFHDGITDIGQGTSFIASGFAPQDGVTVAIADSVRTIQRYAFRNTQATDYSFGAGLRRIHEGSIGIKNSSQVLSFPASLIQADYDIVVVGSTGYYDWQNAKTESGGFLIAGDGVLLWGKPTGTAWTIPEGVKSVCCFAWNNTANVTSVTLPSTTKYLMTGAFAGFGSLQKMKLPQGTKQIYGLAFQNCRNLTKIWIPRSVSVISSAGVDTTTGADVQSWFPFTNCTNLTIYCEAASKPQGWGEYWNYTASGTPANVVWNYPEPGNNW